MQSFFVTEDMLQALANKILRVGKETSTLGPYESVVGMALCQVEYMTFRR